MPARAITVCGGFASTASFWPSGDQTGGPERPIALHPFAVARGVTSLPDGVTRRIPHLV
jgi:hypothetical protein